MTDGRSVVSLTLEHAGESLGGWFSQTAGPRPGASGSASLDGQENSPGDASAAGLRTAGSEPVACEQLQCDLMSSVLGTKAN